MRREPAVTVRARHFTRQPAVTSRERRGDGGCHAHLVHHRCVARLWRAAGSAGTTNSDAATPALMSDPSDIGNREEQRRSHGGYEYGDAEF